MKRILVLLVVLFSIGFSKDLSKSRMLKNACDSGSAKGCSNLGVLYDKGQGVRQNFSTAKQYYSKACDLGLQFGCDSYRKLNEKGY